MSKQSKDLIHFNSLIIKGLPEDEAVLCTESKTYIVRQVNTSNSIVLLDRHERQGRHYVHDDVSNTIELLPCLARLGRLDDLLRESSYSGQENEEELMKSKTFYTLEDLLSTVQASKQELLTGLEKRGAFLHQSHYRLFDKDYLFRLFDSLMTNSTIRGISIDNMMMIEATNCILEEMKKTEGNDDLYIPDNVLKACIDQFTIKSSNSFLKFDHAKVCRFLGEWMLTNPRGKRWKLEEFMEYWSSMGHGTFIPKLQHLSGLYITHETIKIQKPEKYIEYFPINELSTDPPQRFATLFSEKPLWSAEEINPFLEDLAPEKKQKEILLLKFARTHKTNNGKEIVILYGSRIK